MILIQFVDVRSKKGEIMLITKEWVDKVCPNHSRKSCSDNDLSNSFGGWNGRYLPGTGEKKIIHPRCSRCYLLDNVENNTDDLDFEVIVDVFLVYKRSN